MLSRAKRLEMAETEDRYSALQMAFLGENSRNASRERVGSFFARE